MSHVRIPSSSNPEVFVGRDDFAATVDHWWNQDPERFFVVGGSVGTGKTSALATLAITNPAVVAAHFCDPRDISTRLPINAAKNLAEQLFYVSSYATALEDPRSQRAEIRGTAEANEVHPGGINAGVYIASLVVNAGSDQETWDRLLRRPFERLATAGSANSLIVIDALDEADQYDRTTLSELLAGSADIGLLRWLVSTRYPQSFTDRLPANSYRLWSFSEGEGGAETHQAIKVFLDRQLRTLTGSAPPGTVELPALVDTALERSAGNFLYARLLVDTLAELPRMPTLKDITATPADLDGVLRGYLTTIVAADKREVSWVQGYQPVLSRLTVLREPVTQAALARLSGVTSATLTRVLSRLRPLLESSADNRGSAPTIQKPSTRRYSLYHAAFREFLNDQDRADTWWCSPAEAHDQILASYHDLTRGWQDWADLDSYGIAHLFEHAREAHWSTKKFSDLVVPGHVAVLAHQPGSVANVVRRLRVPVEAALAENDLATAFLWSWAAQQLTNSVAELLFDEAPTLLANAGRGELLVSALINAAAVAALNPDPTEEDNRLPYRRHKVAMRLAAVGDISRARSLVALAPPSEHAGLLMACSLGTARTQPDLALELLEEARQFCDSHTDPPGIAELAVDLAANPQYTERSWALASGYRDARRRIALTVAQHEPAKALQIAADNGFADVLARAAGRLARSYPERARKLLDGDISSRETWAITAAEIAMNADLPDMTPRRLADAVGHDPILNLLVLSALACRAELDTELSDHASKQLHVLQGCSDSLIGALGHHGLLDGVGVRPLAATQQASDLAVAMISRVLFGYAAELDFPGSKESRLIGRLCGSLWTLDHQTGDEAMNAMAQHDRLDMASVEEGFINRTCSVDPHKAWAVAQRSHATRAWTEALPASQLQVGIELVATVEEQYSGSRAQLAGLLATKLAPGDVAGAQELLRLLTPATKSVVFDSERIILRAAFDAHDQGDHDSSLTGSTASAEAVGRYARARRQHNSGELLWREVQSNLATTRCPPTDVGELTENIASKTRNTAVAVLAHAAGCLLATGEDPAIEHRTAQGLLGEAVHPDYRPTSVHVAFWPGTVRAMEKAHSRRAQREHTDFVNELTTLAVARDEVPDIVVPLASHFGVFTGSHEWAVRHDPRLANTLDIVRSGLENGPREYEPGLDSLLGSDYEGYPYLRPALVELARQHPAETIDLLHHPYTPNLRSAFDPSDEHLNAITIEILPAITQTDIHAALECATAIRQRNPVKGDDALHTVAMTIAADNWMAGAQIAQSIEFDSVRGMAWADLAAIAARIPEQERRHATYSTILDDLATSPLTNFREYVTNGMLAALTADPAPMPDIVARVLPNMFRSYSPDVASWIRLADFACVVARAADVSDIPARIPDIEQLLNSAWHL